MKTSNAIQAIFERFFNGGLPALLILFARLLQNANGFILTAIVAYRYGLDAVGTLTLATIPITLFALFGTFGLHFRLAQINVNNGVRNTIGLVSAAASLPVIVIIALMFGMVFGHNPAEQLQLSAIALSAPYFAQCNVMNALQVLQGKEAQSIIAPALNSLGLVAGAFSNDFSNFCLVVLAFRMLGIAIPYMLLPHDFSAFGQAFGHLRSGLRYLFSDAVLVASDTMILLLSAHILGRSDLGVLGICRQLLTASDTPGWANLQSVYPKIVTGDDAYFRGLIRSMLRLGALLAIVVTAVAVPMGIYVFKVGDLWFFAAILMSSVPARYVVVCIETHLKARGAISYANWLTAARAIVGFVVVGVATVSGGLLGHIVALACFFISLAVVEYALTLHNKQPGSVALGAGEAL